MNQSQNSFYCFTAEIESGDTNEKKQNIETFLRRDNLNRLGSGRLRMLRHRKVKIFPVMQQLKGRTMNKGLSVLNLVSHWPNESLSCNYTLYICMVQDSSNIAEVACLGQRSSTDACKNAAVF